VPVYVGRARPLARLIAAYQALAALRGGAPACAGVVQVTGEAGIGKTALLTRVSAHVIPQL
jgi:predicted ATP-dependent serine protease